MPLTAGVLRRHAAKEVRSGTPGSRHGNPCVFAPESTGSVRRTQGRLQRCKDAPSSCQTMRACHQNRKWCKISAASCIGSRALYGLDPDRKKLNEAHGPGRQRGRPVTPTDQIALTAFVEPESYSFARGTFRGKWVARGRSPWSKSSADSPDAGKTPAFTASRDRVKLRGLRNRRLKPMCACAPQSGGRNPCDADDDN